MLARQPPTKRRRTLGADKHYKTKEFVRVCREQGFTPHVAQNIRKNRTSAIDGGPRTQRQWSDCAVERTPLLFGLVSGQGTGAPPGATNPSPTFADLAPVRVPVALPIH